MNELQLGLIGAGVMIVAGVMGYNAWQAARERRKLPRAMPVDDDAGSRTPHADHDSPFIDASRSPRRDPVFVKPPGGQGGDGRVEPSFVPVPPADEPVDLAADSAPPEALAEVNGRDPAHAGTAGDGESSYGDATPTRPVPAAGQDTRAQDARAQDTRQASADHSFGQPGAPAPTAQARNDGRTEPGMSARPGTSGAVANGSAGGMQGGGGASAPYGEHGATAASSANAARPTNAAHAGHTGNAEQTGNAGNVADAGNAAKALNPASALNGGYGANGAIGPANAHGSNGTRASNGAMPAARPAVPERIEPIAPAQTISAAPPGLVDPRIDCIVPLRPAAPLPGDKLIALAQRLRRAGTKPVYIDGRREGQHGWEALQAGHRYDDLRAAVQLANRSGALNELEFSEFAVGVQHLADALDGSPELPDMMETVAMARELDGFAAQCDAQLSLNIMSDGAPWSANYVQAVASQDGLLLSRDGTRFVKLDTHQNPVFMLQFGDTNFLRDDLTYKGGNMITLLLDVPVADEDILPFRLMCDYAASLSQRIGARVVDDQRRPLPEASLQAIDKQLLSLYGKLDAAGIPAGSPAARRLFSQ